MSTSSRLPDTPEVIAARAFCRAVLAAFPGAVIRLVERKPPHQGARPVKHPLRLILAALALALAMAGMALMLPKGWAP